MNMEKKQAVLALDIGNSETRGIVLCRKDGVLCERFFTASNRFAEVEPDYMPPEDYSSDTSTVFNVKAVVHGKAFEGTYVNGLVREREFSLRSIRPSVQETKYNAKSTVLSYIMAMYEGYKAVAEIYGKDVTEITVDWQSVVVLLPPGDKDIGQEQLLKLLKSVGTLDIVYPEVCDKIKVKKLVVYPEGFCAFIGALYTRGIKIRGGFESAADDTVLVIDVGAGTTDVLIVKNGKLIDTSRTSIKYGGNAIVQGVGKAFAKSGIDVLESDIDVGVYTGAVRVGSEIKDIVPVINTLKRSVSSMIVQKLRGFFDSLEFPIHSLNKVLVCGGGALAGEKAEINLLSDYLVEYLKELCPSIELMEIPKENERGMSLR